MALNFTIDMRADLLKKLGETKNFVEAESMLISEYATKLRLIEESVVEEMYEKDAKERSDEEMRAKGVIK